MVADVARVVLDDVARGVARRRAITHDQGLRIRGAVERLACDPAVLRDLLEARIAADQPDPVRPEPAEPVHDEPPRFDDWLGQAQWVARSVQDFFSAVARQSALSSSPSMAEQGLTRADVVLDMLAAHPDGRVRAAVVQYLNSDADPGIAAGDPSIYVRREVAAHLPAGHPAWSALAADRSRTVRLAVANAAAAPGAVLMTLANDPDERVRDRVAERVLGALGDGGERS